MVEILDATRRDYLRPPAFPELGFLEKEFSGLGLIRTIVFKVERLRQWLIRG